MMYVAGLFLGLLQPTGSWPDRGGGGGETKAIGVGCTCNVTVALAISIENLKFLKK